MTLPSGAIAQPVTQTGGESSGTTDTSYTAAGGKTVVSVDDGPTAVVTTYSDGSVDIRYKNQPIVDPECQNIDTADINAGLVCQYNVGVPGKVDYIEYRYIPTERWTGKVQSAGELRANMERAASLNAKFPDSARWNIYYNNPSWHGELQGNIAKLATYAADYLPKYIGPTTTSGGAQVFVTDPKTGTTINTTDVRDPTAAITPDGRSLIDIVYPNGQPPTSPISPTNSIPPEGTSGGGTPVAGPLGTSPDTLPILPPRPPTGDIRTMVQTAAASQPNASGGKWVLWAIGAAAIWLLFGG